MLANKSACLPPDSPVTPLSVEDATRYPQPGQPTAVLHAPAQKHAIGGEIEAAQVARQWAVLLLPHAQLCLSARLTLLYLDVYDSVALLYRFHPPKHKRHREETTLFSCHICYTLADTKLHTQGLHDTKGHGIKDFAVFGGSPLHQGLCRWLSTVRHLFFSHECNRSVTEPGCSQQSTCPTKQPHHLNGFDSFPSSSFLTNFSQLRRTKARRGVAWQGRQALWKDAKVGAGCILSQPTARFHAFTGSRIFCGCCCGPLRSVIRSSSHALLTVLCL